LLEASEGVISFGRGEVIISINPSEINPINLTPINKGISLEHLETDAFLCHIVGVQLPLVIDPGKGGFI